MRILVHGAFAFINKKVHDDQRCRYGIESHGGLYFGTYRIGERRCAFIQMKPEIAYQIWTWASGGRTLNAFSGRWNKDGQPFLTCSSKHKLKYDVNRLGKAVELVV